MSSKEKIDFINALIDNVRKNILEKVNEYPEEWDGVELRWLIKDHFNLVVFGGYNDKRDKRYKEYENHVICNNLV